MNAYMNARWLRRSGYAVLIASAGWVPGCGGQGTPEHGGAGAASSGPVAGGGSRSTGSAGLSGSGAAGAASGGSAGRSNLAEGGAAGLVAAIAGAGGTGAGGLHNASGAGGVTVSAGSSGSGGSAAGASTIGTPKNPVLAGLYADPQIAAFGNKFYIYPTTDGFANWLGTQFHAFSSTDLVTWKDEGVILDLGPDVSWADDRAWAPGIALKGGTYYFYFSAAQAIGVATASSPTGPFKDALGHPLVASGQYGVQAIDPYVFTDDDGRSYLYFGSSSSGRVVELNADMVSMKGTPQTLTVAGFREASVAFKRNGKYYYMWSENDTRSADYDVAYGMGTSPMGPFTKPALNPILKKDTAQGILGTGHNSVLALPNGDYYIAYHRFAIPNGDGTHREVCLDRLEFNADGTIAAVKPTR
jgi:beta-xylosidase